MRLPPRIRVRDLRSMKDRFCIAIVDGQIIENCRIRCDGRGEVRIGSDCPALAGGADRRMDRYGFIFVTENRNDHDFVDISMRHVILADIEARPYEGEDDRRRRVNGDPNMLHGMGMMDRLGSGSGSRGRMGASLSFAHEAECIEREKKEVARVNKEYEKVVKKIQGKSYDMMIVDDPVMDDDEDDIEEQDEDELFEVSFYPIKYI